MYNTDIPNREALPSTAKLIRSTIIAAIVALVLLVTVVMPAEYALDPTGAGQLLGLTEMGEIKEQLAEEAAADAAAEMVAVQSSADQKTQEVSAPVVAEAIDEPAPPPEIETASAEPEPATEQEVAKPQWQDEVRVVLTPGQGTEFKLTMEEGAVARFSCVPEDEGELEAAFTGDHGWFFRNRNDNEITLVLRTGGDYGQLKKVL